MEENAMTGLLTNAATVISKIVENLGTVCTALISNPLFQIMFGILIFYVVFGIVFRLVKKVRKGGK